MVRMNGRPAAGGASGGNAGKRRGDGAVHGSQAAALPRVRKKAGGGESGSGRSRHAAAAVERPQASPVYDSSDSFENHVIDLRGSNVEDEDEVTVRGTPSSEELSVRNGNAYCESDSEGAHANGQWTHSNDKNQNRLVRAQVDDSVRERDNRAREHHFTPGQVTWAKFARFPWWPAQVIDERDIGDAKGGVRGSDTDLLVRFFGTYDYGWVDPYSNLSDFDVKLAERSRIRKKALQKGVEEAIAFRDSGKLPKQWEPVPLSSKKKKRPTPKSNVSNERKTPRKKTPKVIIQEDEVEQKSEALQRRVRIMRQLGLVAPAGSPFAPSLNISD